MSLALDVLYEDEHCLALVKPAGQFTQGSWAPPGEQTLEQAVRDYLAPGDPGSAYVGIVHRLDRAVSGVLLWAKNSRSARRLSRQFERRSVRKEYWGIVEPTNAVALDAVAVTHVSNQGSQAEEIWTDWLTSPGNAGVASAAKEGEPGARLGVTRIRPDRALELPQGCAWVRLWPQTGRTHQLRVQSASRGMPILGDAAYGATRPFAPGIALHARSLEVCHPVLQTPLELIAPLPLAWVEQGISLPESGASGHRHS
jgi:23S rRNA pseudouridine1911/1915/1917 synthase